MTSYRLLSLLPLLLMVALAAVQDLRTRKIRNWLTLSLGWSGLLCSLFALTRISPMQSVLGLLAGFALTFVLFAMGALGGGDVKLVAGVGAWIGPTNVLAVFVLAALVGLVIVLSQSLAQGRVATLFRNSAVLLLNIRHMHDLGADHVEQTAKSCRSVDRPLPYAVPVFFATLLLVMLR